jgi:undecaprenyl-diphosphatase
MVIVPVLGANLIEVITYKFTGNSIGIGILAAGFFSAFIAGYFACRWMIDLVKKSKLIWFAVYCAIAGTLAILLG